MKQITAVLALATLVGCGGGGGMGPSGPSGGTPPQPTPAPTGTPTPTPTPAPTPEPTPTPSTPQTLRSATFRSANGYSTEGSASIVRDGDAYRLELGNDFRTSQSNALDVRLCGNPNCSNGELNLGSIKSFSGYQQYRLDDEAAPFSHVVIWCRAVSLPFGYGELS